MDKWTSDSPLWLGSTIGITSSREQIKLHFVYFRRKSLHVIQARGQWGTEYGYLEWSAVTNSVLQKGEINAIYVTLSLRRQGFATKMYFLAKRIDPSIRHSSDRTVLGDLWARSVGGIIPPKK